MKKIVFIPCGVLPIPAVMGGAVENLVQQLLELNEKNPQYNFLVYTPYTPSAFQKSKVYKYTEFVFIKNKSFCYKLQSIVLRLNSKIKSLFEYDFMNQYLNIILKDMIHREDIEYVILENAPKYAIQIRKHLPKVKIIQHYHNVPEELNIWKSVDAATDIYFCISEFIKNKVVSTFHLQNNKEKAQVFYNCINTKRFQCESIVQKKILREKLNIPEKDTIIIYTGRLQPYKGVKELLLAFKQLNVPNVKLLIVGGSFFAGYKKNKFTKELENIASQLSDKVIFTGFIPYEKIQLYYLISDIAVIPSICEEAFGLTCLEAMSSGLPVIATATGGIPEVVNKESAILINNDSNLINNIASSLIFLIEDKEKREQMSKAALKRASQFTLESYWNNFKYLISNIS